MSLIPTYVCDTIPPARLATFALLSDPSMDFDQPAIFSDNEPPSTSPKHHNDHQENGSPPPSQGPPPRKLCVRHQRMADEGTNLKLQQACPLSLLTCRKTNSPKIVSRRLTCRRTGSRQRSLVQFFLLITRPTRAHPPGSPHNVLLLPIIFAH
jgi:hypothetical protein